MPAQKAAEVLRAALTDLPRSAYIADHIVLAPIQQKVYDAVDELKAAGTPPERVILAIKEIASATTTGPVASILVQRIVNWSVEQYFKG
jgi:hypothetical protein